MAHSDNPAVKTSWFKIFFIGRRVLVIGRRVLVIGRRVLVIG